MIYLFLSVCCSVSVSVLLKLAKRYHIDIRQAITWNYSAAALLTMMIYRPALPPYDRILLPTYISLGFLLPSIFLVLGLSVRYTGIVRTDIAQRLSLFIPVLAAFLIFGEGYSVMKITGIAIAFIAIIFSIPWQQTEERKTSYWIYPLIVFVGMGIIDILFKQIAKNSAVPYTSSLFAVFILAFLISLIFLMYLYKTGKIRLSPIDFFCGIILGIANFGNILFYLKAHQALARQPSLVFSGMNIGVIVLGSLTGLILFREKLSRLNYAGIILALISILLMSRT